MELILKRRYKGAMYTISDLYIAGKKVCEVLEPADRNLCATYPEAVIRQRKAIGKTAIPRGTYHIDMATVSPKFRYRQWAAIYGGKLPRLLSVPGYEGVLLHVGNTIADTEACLLPGWNKVKGKVVNSTLAFAMLMDNYLIPAYERGEDITITIQDA